MSTVLSPGVIARSLVQLSVPLLFGACASPTAGVPAAPQTQGLSIPAVQLRPRHGETAQASSQAVPSGDPARVGQRAGVGALTPEEAAEDPDFVKLISQLDRWARSVIQVETKSSVRSEHHCFDQAQTAEVRCGSPQARKSSPTLFETKQSTLTNAGQIPLECWMSAAFDLQSWGRSLAALAANAGVSLEPGHTETLPAIEHSTNEFLDRSAIICDVASASIQRTLGVDPSRLTGGADRVSIVLTGSGTTYQFTARHAPGVFTWSEVGVLMQ